MSKSNVLISVDKSTESSHYDQMGGTSPGTLTRTVAVAGERA
jgi:hypothetical protein